MNRILFTFLLLLVYSASFCQDTVIVHDYTQIMVTVDNNGSMNPVTSLAKEKSAGFFMEGSKDGVVRVCSDSPLTIWSNGRLIKKVENGCELIDVEDFYKNDASDTVFVSVNSLDYLSSLSFDKVIYQDQLIVKDDPKLPRTARDIFQEFTFTALIVIASLFGFLLIQHPGRLSHIANRSFSLKQNTYELVGTQFISEVGISLVVLLSLIFSFFGIYGASKTIMDGFLIPSSYQGFIILWLKISSYFLVFILAKWLFITIISRLFGFRKVNDFQLFDFLNYGLIIGVVLSLFVLLDFVFRNNATWIPTDFPILLISIIAIFIGWFALKFVNNYPLKKLLIIAYLCATEIIPTMIIIGWFYK